MSIHSSILSVRPTNNIINISLYVERIKIITIKLVLPVYDNS